MRPTQLAQNIHTLGGAVSVGIIVDGDHALLIDCCDTVTPDVLRSELGIEHVDMILITQHRRPNSAGAYVYAATGAEIVVPKGERDLIEHGEEHWNDPKNRWHLYHHQPGPMVPARNLPVSRDVSEGDSVEWHGHTIRVLDTPGATDGSVSYVVEADNRTICFSGDAIYGSGQVYELHAFQKGNERIGDYHGFLGNLAKLTPSLQKLRGLDLLVPSHGDQIEEPDAAIDLLTERLGALWSNYVEKSCLNHYFPDMLAENTPEGLSVPEPSFQVQTSEPPAHVMKADYTTWILRSDSGAALMIDCGHDMVVDQMRSWLEHETISRLDGLWITHYHDDHVDAIPNYVATFGGSVETIDPLRDVIEHPEAWFLPCISPAKTAITKTRRHGESWRWEEFTLTAFHHPGQTFYHSGLLVEGHGTKVFFAGDSGSPTGLDDHCCPNRNPFHEPGNGMAGFRQCLEIWRKTMPDYIFNNHQHLAYRFTEAELDSMEETLRERNRIVAEITPWEDGNFALDEGWVRTYPYEQTVHPGDMVVFEVHATNHSNDRSTLHADAVAPDGWLLPRRGGAVTRIAPRTDGSVEPVFENPDGSVRLTLRIPPDAAAGMYVIPVRITLNDRYLGQYRHAIVNVAT
jgi:glyoxylase-like metal-dependent hydrolase (beta-lactamase superfamily II)